ncbi:MAG: methyltransferase domain-containing protein [Thermoleophilia bacterium]
MNACTIVARNYLGQATVLAESFAAHHPGGSLTTLVIDAEAGLPDGLSPALGAVGFEATGLDATEYHRMAACYSVVEFATAVKPFLLRALLAGGLSDVTYLDPDIEVFADLSDIGALAREHGVVLTPHLERPLPRDARMTDIEAVVRDAGVFNLGFVGVGASALPFLDWWAERLARDCIVDVRRALFVDQRWIDLVPGYFPHHILRDPTIDVAWWNMALRRLERDGDGWTVEGLPLRFFHFSGYDPRRPHLLSTHAGEVPRVLMSEQPALRALCDGYAAKLRAAGHDRLREQAYGFASTAAIVPLDARARDVYRRALIDAEERGDEEPPNPFGPDGDAAFLAWLREPVGPPDVPDLPSRYLRAIHADRPDLQARFPAVEGADARAYLAWCATEGRTEEAIPGALLPAPPAAGPPAPPPALREGLQIAGYMDAEAGVGEAARRMLAAVNAAGVPHALVTYDRTPSRRGAAVVSGDDGDYDVALALVNADQFPTFNHDMGPRWREGRYVVGFWWWEVERFPMRFRGALDLVDEVWAGSAFVRDAVAATSDTPVHVLPVPLTPPTPRPGTRAELGLGDGFLFYFSFDFASVMERKNPIGLIDAYTRAFAAGDGARLLLRGINGDLHPLELERLRDAAAARDDVVVMDGYLDGAAKDGLMCECDCYVSLHRSEGLGLTMAEAMAAGRPVVATGYSGNLEFMHEGNSLLVGPGDLIPIGPGRDPYPPEARWADPDLDDAAGLMRRVFDDPQEAAHLAARGRDDVLERFSVARAGAALAEHLERIHARRRGVAAAPAGPPLDRARRWLAEGPSVPWDAPAPKPQTLARRGLLRAMHPYLARRAEFDLALVQTAEEAAQRIAQLEALEQRLWTAVGELDERLARLEQVRGVVDELRATLRARPHTADPARLVTTDPEGREAIGFDPGAADADGYRGFEDVFRGGEDFIRERMRPYVPLVRDLGPVADLGCGRGEFLDLMAEAGIPAEGIDLDAGMVARCRDKGHRVEQADALAWLRARGDGSFGAVFSAQVIEHLAHDDLLALLREARRVLRPGGLLIAETVNPHPIASFKAFWVDLTHTSPIFPEVAVVLCGLAGFGAARVMFPVGTGDLDRDLWAEGQYAVVATAVVDTPGP